jgi:RNA polymerase sigma-70 factor (ECF subfamily)
MSLDKLLLEKYERITNEKLAELGQSNGCLKEVVDVLGLRIKSKLRCFIYKIVGDTESAEDVYQETMVNIFEGFYSYDTSRSFETWAFKVARNCAIDYIRKRKPATSYYESGIEEIFEVKDTNSNPEELMIYKEQRNSFFEAINSLPEKYKEVSTLFYLNEIKLEQISELTGDNINTLRWRSHRAGKLLKKSLKAKV